MILGGIGNLPGLGIIVQSIQSDRMTLKDRKSRVSPTEEDLDQAPADLLLLQQALQRAAAKPQHDLDGIRLGDWEKRALRRQEPVGGQAVGMRVEPGRVIPARLHRGDHSRKER